MSVSVDPKAGGPDFAALKLLADPAELDRRIKQYEAAKQEAEDAVKLVGDAREIPHLRREAGDLHTAAEKASKQAESELAAARAQAETIVDKAKKEAAALLSDAKSKNDQANATLTAAAAKAAQIVSDSENDAKSKADETAKKHSDLDDAIAAAQAQQAAADKAKAEADAALKKYLDKLDRLQAIASS